MRRRRLAPAARRKMTWTWAGMFYQQANVSEDLIFATWARVPAGEADNSDSSGVPVVIPPDWTLIRSRVHLAVTTDIGGNQSNYPWVLSTGLIAWDGVSDDPSDVGLYPHPYYDQEADWIWRNDQMFTATNIFQAVNSVDVDAYQSKAMRKLSNGTGLLLVQAFADPIGVLLDQMTIHSAVSFRGLYKLP